MILPPQLDLPAPFPRIVSQAPQIERIAPGVEYGDYGLSTDAGPVSIHVVAIDTKNPDVSVRTVLANDALGPNAETISSMARRTGAIAGVNADYFDIGRSNHPTNIVVRSGTLIRTPQKRYALTILRSGEARFAEFSFTGSVQIGTQAFPLEGINAFPSGPGSITLITPAFGEVAADAEASFATLQPTAAATFGAYRVTSLESGTQPQAPGYYLALDQGSDAAQLLAGGDTIDVSGDLSPFPLSQLSCAVGGGPLILRNGRWFEDPDGPASGALERRIPSSGAALAPDGTLLLVEVDGRQPQVSVGLTRPELAEVMRALGASEGIAFDGGGSAEMAVQLPGEPAALLETSPSDGPERRVADGIFVYNVAPASAPARIASDPQTIRALPQAQVPLHLEVLDASDRPATERIPIQVSVEPKSLGSVSADGNFVAERQGAGAILLRAGALTASVPVRIDAAPSRIVVAPGALNLDPHGSVTLHARAFDSAGFALWLPAHLDWSSSSGSIDDQGRLVVADRNADVRLDIEGQIAAMQVTVGHHDLPLDLGEKVQFLTLPRGGPGDANAGSGCDGCLHLQYALGESEHAAYAIVERELPDASVGLSFVEQDDGGGALLRIVVRNAIGEQALVTVTRLDAGGPRRITVRFPQGILQPVRLVGFYVIGTKDVSVARGSVSVSDLRVLVAGTP
jgi:hypothetical protein